MKDTRRRLEIFSTYDYCGIQRHLTKMAKRGWMLMEMGNYTWKYRRCEPSAERFAVTYFPEASAFDPEPGEDHSDDAPGGEGFCRFEKRMKQA